MPTTQADADLIAATTAKAIFLAKLSPGGHPDPDVDFIHMVLAARNWARAAAGYTNTLEPSLAAMPNRTDLANAVRDITAAIPSPQTIADVVSKAVPVGTLTDTQIQAIATAVANAQPKPPVYTATLVPGAAAAQQQGDAQGYFINDSSPGTDGAPVTWELPASEPAADAPAAAEESAQ
jgi:hypothetical protein